MRDRQSTLNATRQSRDAADAQQGHDKLASECETLTRLLSFGCDTADAVASATRLLGELKSLPRAVAAEGDTYRRLGIPDGAVAVLQVFRQTMEQSLRISLSDAPVIGSWAALIDYLHVSMAWRQREVFRVLFLNSTNHLIADDIMTTGTVNQTAVYVREIIKRALDLHATGLILAHNHPSGAPKPSRDDIQLTNQIRDACRVLGIILHDHIVVAASGHASFKSLGLL